MVRASDVRAFVLAELAEPLRAKGLTPEEVPDDFDLLLEGVIDSLGIMLTIAAVEDHFGIDVDFEELDPEDLTVIGSFSRYVEDKSSSAEVPPERRR